MEGDIPKDTLLFTQLLLSFHTAAMQQMGKIVHPLSGQIVRDLGQASMSIDMLDMLKTKCRGNLTEEEERLLDHILSELKLNYVEEIGRPAQGEDEAVKATQNSAESAEGD